jgi:hypothetical protein
MSHHRDAEAAEITHGREERKRERRRYIPLRFLSLLRAVE